MWKVRWKTHAGDDKVLYGVSYERAMKQREWCNRIRYPLVIVQRIRGEEE